MLVYDEFLTETGINFYDVMDRVKSCDSLQSDVGEIDIRKLYAKRDGNNFYYFKAYAVEFLNALQDVNGRRHNPHLSTTADIGSYKFRTSIIVYEDTVVGELPKVYELDEVRSIATDLDLSMYGFKRVGISRWVKRQVND